MSFETRLMAPGRFAVDLVDDTPEHIAALTGEYGTGVIVIPGQVFNPNKVPLANLYADAAYVGIHVARPNKRLGFSGYGPAHLLRLARAPADQTVPKRPLYNGTSNTSPLRNTVLRVGVAETNGLEVGPLTAGAAVSSYVRTAPVGVISSGYEPRNSASARRSGDGASAEREQAARPTRRSTRTRIRARGT